MNNSIYLFLQGLAGNCLVFCIHDPFCVDYQSHHQQLEFECWAQPKYFDVLDFLFYQRMVIVPRFVYSSTYLFLLFHNIQMFFSGVTLRNRSSSFRLACVVSFFGIFIIMNYFTASYTSELSIPNFKTTVSSIEDLANNRAVNPLLVKGSSSDEFIMASF